MLANKNRPKKIILAWTETKEKGRAGPPTWMYARLPELTAGSEAWMKLELDIVQRMGSRTRPFVGERQRRAGSEEKSQTRFFVSITWKGRADVFAWKTTRAISSPSDHVVSNGFLTVDWISFIYSLVHPYCLFSPRYRDLSGRLIVIDAKRDLHGWVLILDPEGGFCFLLAQRTDLSGGSKVLLAWRKAVTVAQYIPESMSVWEFRRQEISINDKLGGGKMTHFGSSNDSAVSDGKDQRSEQNTIRLRYQMPAADVQFPILQNITKGEGAPNSGAHVCGSPSQHAYYSLCWDALGGRVPRDLSPERGSGPV
ncbi:hypothetical protein ARMGADRAFT_1036084 [Armillaria gallica]|uniref:Uncharacterized protein n=1 Tax=Armillaria gallica TaxID=47427 RepID=A0A2H3CVY3_ARMGA|nr:hypothetical protein ARMGADRAFT_1036084 [Armillaria gallica]